jgi:ABC-2 type transport system permease protein
VQVVLILALATVLGWEPNATAGVAVVGVLLGTSAFAGIGLILAGRLPGVVNLAVTNALYLVLLLVGGMVFPLDKLPGPLETLARLTPAAALAEVLRAGLNGGHVPAGAFALLLAWGVLAPVAAALLFRWEP